MRNVWKDYRPFRGLYDPCPPIPKSYVLPPNLFLLFQPPGMKQYSPREALRHGTLWPDLYSSYPRVETKGVSR